MSSNNFQGSSFSEKVGTAESTERRWRLFYGGEHEGARNMALDIALSGDVSVGGYPALRLYRFKPPAVTVGRFQDIETSIDEAACAAEGVDVVRRPTGGMAILHKDDLTYSVVIPRGGLPAPAESAGAFRMIARGIECALRILGIEAREATHEDRRKEVSPWCLESTFGVDLEFAGRKICGSAQRVFDKAILQHGSLFLSDNTQLMSRLSFPGEMEPRSKAFVTLGEAARRDISWHEVAHAFINGFSVALEVDFIEVEDEKFDTAMCE